MSTRMLHPEISGGCDTHMLTHAHTFTHMRTHMPAFVTDKLEEAQREILGIVRRLADEGQIQMSTKSEDFL